MNIQYTVYDQEKVKKILMKQLELLHEDSKKAHGIRLAKLSEAMGMLANAMINYNL